MTVNHMGENVKNWFKKLMLKGWQFSREPAKVQRIAVKEDTRKMIKEIQSLKWGDQCRAKCGAPARYIGNGRCLFVSASCNDLCKDDAAPPKGNEHEFPLPDDYDLRSNAN